MGWQGLARQRGMSGGGWFMVIVLLFGAASVGLRLIPHYMDHNIVDGQIRALLEDDRLGSMTQNDVFDRLKSGLKMNNIREFEPKGKLKVERGAGVMKMDLFYEVREPLFWNVDVILTFEEHYEKVL